MNTKNALQVDMLSHNRRHPSLLMEDLLDDLLHEQAFGWLIQRIDQDRHSRAEPLFVYRTTLFAIYVDYNEQSVFVSAELGCHPPDEKFSLIDFYNTVKENMPVAEPEAGEAIKYGDNISVYIYKKRF